MQSDTYGILLDAKLTYVPLAKDKKVKNNLYGHELD